jgi:hypothetical protein
MCVPALPLIAAGVKIATTVAGQISRAKEAAELNAQAAESRANAHVAYLLELQDEIARQGEIRAAAVEAHIEGNQLARESGATAKVAAAEAGVAGVSVDLLLGDIERQGGKYQRAVERNLKMDMAQSERQKRAAGTRLKTRLASIQKFKGPSLLDTGLRIGTDVVGYFSAKSQLGDTGADTTVAEKPKGVRIATEFH